MKTDDDKPGEGLRRRIERQAHQLAAKVKTWLPRGAGFVLIVFDQPDKPQARDAPGWLTYVSSVERDGGAAIVDGLFARWRNWPGKPKPTAADVDDLGRMMQLEAGLNLSDIDPNLVAAREVVRKLAAAALKLGASPDLARATWREWDDAAGKRPS